MQESEEPGAGRGGEDRGGESCGRHAGLGVGDVDRGGWAGANVFEAGIEKLRTGKFSGYISGVVRDDDDGQDMYGVKIRTAYRCMPEFEFGVGAEIDVMEREIAYFDTDDSDQDESTNTRLWVFGSYDFTKKVNLEAKFERVESDLWDYYNRGRIRLNLLF